MIRALYKETETSPTISLVGLYIIALTAAHEGRTVITADVAGAYLRAFMKKLVLIKINQEESQMLIEMYPKLEEYLDDQGKLTAECLKALYGLKVMVRYDQRKTNKEWIREKSIRAMHI